MPQNAIEADAAPTVDGTYIDAANVDSLGGDKTALKSVEWDRIETKTAAAGVQEVLGVRGAQETLLERTEEEPQPAELFQIVENGISYDLERRADGSEWLLGRTGETHGGASIQHRPPDAPPEIPEDDGTGGGGGFGDLPRGTAPDMALGVLAGVNTAVEEFAKATRLDKVADFLEEKIPLGSIEFPLPETTAGQVTAGFAQVGAGMVPAARVTRSLQAVSSFLRWTTAGALTDLTVFSPDDPGLGGLAAELGELDNDALEGIRSVFADAFAKDVNDSELKKRLKNVGEGVIAGAMIDGLVKLYRGTRGVLRKMIAVGTAGAALSADEAQATLIGAFDAQEEGGENVQLAGFVDKIIRPLLGKAGREAARTTPGPRPLKPPVGEQEILQAYDPYRAGSPVIEGLDFNLERLETSDQVKELIDTVSSAYAGKIEQAAGGVIPHDVSRQVADLIGANADAAERAVKGLPGDVENLHARALAMRDMMVKSAEAVDVAALKVAADPANATDLELIAFREAVARHAALQANMKGVQTEIARALSSFRIPAEAAPLARAQMIQESLNGAGGRDTVSTLARLWLETPVEYRGALVQGGLVEKSVASLKEYWINGLLSGFRTHEINFVSNQLFTFWQIPERFIAGGIGAVRGGGDRVFLHEGVDLLHGWVEGFPDAIRLAWGTFKSGEPASALARIENTRYRAISAQNWGLDEKGLPGRFVDLVGTGVRLPGRFLMTADEFQKGIGRAMESRAMAYRFSQIDLAQGKSTKDAAQTYQDVLDGRHEAAEAAIGDFADTVTFTRALGEGGQAIQKTAAKVPGAWLIAPFIRTPVNVVKEFIKRTPASPFMKEVREDLLAGGARRDLALAKISTGTTAMAYGSYLAAQGVITGGGPTDPRMRRVWLEKFRPYSMKIGDQWYPYGRLEPIGMLFGVAADLTEFRTWAPRDIADEATPTMTSRAIMSVLHTVSEKTFFTGIAEFTKAFDDPERYGERYVQRLFGTLVPFSSMTRDIESAIDPARRDTRRNPYADNPFAAEFEATLNEWRGRTPGFSEGLPPRLNHWGEEVVAYEGNWVNAFNAFAPRTDRSQPIDEELIRLRFPLSMPQRAAHGVKLDSRQYHTLITAMNDIRVPVQGREMNMREYMNWLVGSAPYAMQMNDESRIDILRDVRAKFLDAAKGQMITPGSPFFDTDLFSLAIQAGVQAPLGLPVRP